MRTFLLLLLMTAPALADEPTVVTDIAPVHSLVAQVMEGVAAPALLLPTGSDPHHLTLRPSQARALADADVVIWIGPALTPWLAEALAGRDGQSLPLAGDLVEGVDDPHQWLDPVQARAWLDTIAGVLAVADPANAATYRANATTAQADIDTLTDQIAAQLTKSDAARLLTAHDAWGHFADRFDLTIVGAIRQGDDDAPGARHLATLRQLVSDGEVDCILSEVVDSDALVELIAGNSGVATTSVNPLGAGIQPGPDFYSQHLGRVALSITDCVGAD